MAITNYLVHFKTQATYESTVASNPLRNDAVAFIKDATIIHTHGTDYYCGKSEVALKTDLDGKANSDHTHSAADITSGTLAIARIPTGTTASTVALGSHTHATWEIGSLHGYTPSDSYETLHLRMNLNEALSSLQKQIQMRALSDTLDDYALKTEIPDTSTLATKTELAGYLPLTGGTLTGNLIIGPNKWISFDHGTISSNENGLFIDNNVTFDDVSLYKIFEICGGSGLTIKSDAESWSSELKLQGGQKTVSLNQGGFTYNGDQILTEANWNSYITTTDTKNTTGTSNSTSKLYLTGGTSQSSTGVVTYSNTSVYMQSGQLYATRMNATNGFYETSDGTLKNIKSELNIADNIDKIPTVLFSWKKDESEDINQDVPVHVGTIAQDIQKIYPDLVSEDAEGYLTVDYARLSVVAIAAIKELKKEIEVLKSKIN